MSARPVDAGHARAMARSLAWLYLVAALLAPITIFAPHHPGTDIAGVAIVGIAAAAVGVGLRLGSAAIPAAGSELLLALGTIFTGVAIHVTDGVPNAASLLYLWVALYAFYFLPRRRAVLQVLLIGSCYATVIALRPPPFPPVAHWATTMVSVAVAGLIVGWLKARVDGLIERLRERAEALARSEEEMRLVVDTAQHAFVAFDGHGRVREWSVPAEAAFGWTREEALGQSLETLIVPERHRATFRRMAAALLAGEDGLPEGRYEAVALDRRGGEIPVEISAAVLPRADGPLVSVFLSDISERRRLERARDREQRFLDTVLESIETGIVACDSDGELAFFNRASRDLHGLPAEPLPGEEWASRYGLYEADGRTPLALERVPLLRAYRGERVSDEVVIGGEDGDQRSVVCNGRPIVDDAGRRLGAVVALTDMTVRKQAEAALRDRERQLNEAQALAHVGSWEWHTSDGSLQWSDEQCRIFGLTEAPATAAGFLALVHPEDRERVLNALRGMRRGDELTLEHRIVRPGGEIREVYVRCELTDRSHRAAPILLGTCQDVTQRNRAERAMARHTAEISRIAELSRSLAWAGSADEAAGLACEAALELSGASAARLIGVGADGSRPLLSVAGDVSRTARVEVQPVVSPEEPKALLELGWPDEAPLMSERVRELIQLVAADLGSALERLELLRRLEEAARRDELTGLPNRRVWEEQLPREIARARRDGESLAVVLLDLDFFKRYNDEHGHQAGDRLLARTALKWIAELRPTDLLARYGGEEFGLLLPDCGPDEAMAIVERLREATPGGQRCSAGIAVWQPHEGAESVVARADTALYAAKAGGRDRSCFAEQA